MTTHTSALSESTRRSLAVAAVAAIVAAIIVTAVVFGVHQSNTRAAQRDADAAVMTSVVKAQIGNGTADPNDRLTQAVELNRRLTKLNDELSKTTVPR